MQFRISDTFTTSLARLSSEEQKLAKLSVFDLQMNPANPGHQLHKLDRAKDPNFWSVRVSRDIRIIVHRTESSFLLCYVDHHDDAYAWAAKRRLEVHPTTGAAQIVQIRETVQEVPVFRYVETEVAIPVATKAIQPKLFEHLNNETLLSYGVPTDWLEEVRSATESTLLELSDVLPAEAAEALLELATGGTPKIRITEPATVDPFSHPDAQRRFRVVNTSQELELALDYPWDKWTVFLHPDQKQLVERDFNGPARVSGSAGTGKTVVALHRAVHLVRANLDSRVLLTTFSPTLANLLRSKIRRLIGDEPVLGERLQVEDLFSVCRRLYSKLIGPVHLIDEAVLKEIVNQASASVADHKFSTSFLKSEWLEIVDAWGIETWDEYRDVRRLGRKTRLSEVQRALLWSIFERVNSELTSRHLITESGMYSQLAKLMGSRTNPPFDFAVVDEAQDIGVAQLRFLAALGGTRPNSLFFAGDLGQRIFQPPFSWRGLGVDIRGRSKTLHINYRTSHQIRSMADRLLDAEMGDVDGNVETRKGTVSVFNGPKPKVVKADSLTEERDVVVAWLEGLKKDNYMPNEIGIIVRTEAELPRAIDVVNLSGLKYKILDSNVEPSFGSVSIATMHLAKGLEFRAVAVMACDDEILPLQSRIEQVTDDADLEEVYNTERHLLYVACTRARDQLLVTSGGDSSEFLDDLT